MIIIRILKVIGITIVGIGALILMTGLLSEGALIFWIAFPILCILTLCQWLKDKIKKRLSHN